MNDDVPADEVFEIDPSDSDGVLARMPWWLILSAAVVVTEMTAHPSIGVTVLCLKFGWNDFRTALWLRHRDPNRTRGRVCCGFFVASGLWRVCLWSIGFSFISVFIVVANDAQQPQRGPNRGPELPPEMVACMITWLASFSAATVLTVASSFRAWWHGFKVWISAEISASRIRDAWPPRPFPQSGSKPNLMKWWLIGSLAGVFAVVFLFGMIGLFGGVNRQPPNPPKGGFWIVGLISGAIPFLTALVILVITGLILEKIDAKSPAECWPDEASAADPGLSG